MSIDHESRTNLQNALVGYMAGRIRTYAFDDQNTACKHSSDKSVQEISRFLFTLHDDFIDHPISVAPTDWDALLRVVVFLGTELEIRTTEKEATWPFHNIEEWRSYEAQLSEFDLPEYEISVHDQIVNPWWNRIPSSAGFLVLGCIVAGVIAMLSLL